MDKRKYDFGEYKGGNNTHVKANRTDEFCPRCQQRAVNKAYRKCVNCDGILYWLGDDCLYAERNYIDYYIWLRNLEGIWGWYHSSFRNAITLKY